ncbi:TPA: hypothetical protein M5K54_003720 [Citrobacter freundii]|nr:hypothetical protein [Citrobacter freundii]
MKINLIEMEGLLRGQCIPSDLIVNETLAEYLVRQFGKLEQQLAAVVAENAGLKEFCKNAAFDADYEAELGMERGGFTDALNDIQTPATDAFLAEVRAQESKRVYESILDNPAVTDMESLVDWLEQNANDSVAFAAQLRKGVQS